MPAKGGIQNIGKYWIPPVSSTGQAKVFHGHDNLFESDLQTDSKREGDTHVVLLSVREHRRFLWLRCIISEGMVV